MKNVIYLSEFKKQNKKKRWGFFCMALGLLLITEIAFMATLAFR